MRPGDVRWCVLSTAEILVINIDKELHGTGGKYLETELNNVQQPERARKGQSELERVRESQSEPNSKPERARESQNEQDSELEIIRVMSRKNGINCAAS